MEVNLGALPGLTLVAAEQQEWITLVQFVAFVNDPVWKSAQSVVDRRLRQDMARAREVLGETAYSQAWAAGLQLQVADVVELADRLAQVPVQPLVHPALTPRELEVLALAARRTAFGRLGLSNVRRVVNRHGGWIRASTPPEGGWRSG
ncbi:hypothetical protein HLB42_18235 (plasmid) [Deinococcus sp. D7000]|nr:hypothetical protein HLB42_18235 [Deinococcus sp. D7000]